MLKTSKEFLPHNDKAFYVFDISCLKARISYIKSFMPSHVDLCYAVKANTFITKEIIGDVERFEICSPGEYEICEQIGVPASKMVISGIYKTPEFIEKLVELNGTEYIFTIESLTQFEHLKMLSEKYQKTVKLLVRLTNNSQFGINADEIEGIIADRSKYTYLDIQGIQYFSGTQKNSVKKLNKEIKKVYEFLCLLKNKYGYQAAEFEYGTGFPVSYFEGEDINEKNLFDEFSELISNMEYKTKVIIELGRSIVASCGFYYTHIVDMKHNKGQNYAIIDGGMHHLVYYGQYMAMKQPKMFVVGKEELPINKEWNICGSLCSMNDIVSKQNKLPEIEIGDILCFKNTGAYCMTEGISLFLSRDIPAVYLLNENGKYICVRESFESYNINKPQY